MTEHVAIIAEGLTRQFGSLVAVDGVDLRVPAGRLFGFLGRNGAGKTTLIRMLLGLIRPTSGRASILGRHVDSRGGPNGPWPDVGYLVDGPGLYPELTTREHLTVAARYRGIAEADVADAVERMSLGRYLEVRARALSQGNRQRLGLALALAHRPSVLILDEPTVGMDPAGVVEIRSRLRELADGGTTVFMSSHIVSEVELLSDEVGIIHEGRLIEVIDRAGLVRLGQPRLVLTLPSPTEARRAQQTLTEHGIHATLTDAEVTTIDKASLAQPEELVRALVAQDCSPRGVQVVTENLETHFLDVTGSTR